MLRGAGSWCRSCLRDLWKAERFALHLILPLATFKVSERVPKLGATLSFLVNNFVAHVVKELHLVSVVFQVMASTSGRDEEEDSLLDRMASAMINQLKAKDRGKKVQSTGSKKALEGAAGQKGAEANFISAKDEE